MKTKVESATLTFIRSFATGVLLSMVFFYCIHYFGEWRMENYRPDPETTSSLLLHNTCAVLNSEHTLRPGSDSASGGVDGIKFAASFMNFADGHILGMFILALLLGLIIFPLRNKMKKKKQLL